MLKRIALVLSAAALVPALVAVSGCGDDSSSNDGERAARQELRQQLQKQQAKERQQRQRERQRARDRKQQQRQQQAAAAQAAQEQQTTTTTTEAAAENCSPGYSPCLAPATDYDCEGGTGDGPEYTGLVQVTGSDPYDLDSDGNGTGCEE